MNDEIYLEYSAFLRSLKANRDIPHSFLLGAGASVSSGVQSAEDCIWEWKRDIYLSNNSNSPSFYNNYRIVSVKDSIQRWLDTQGLYPPENDVSEYTYYAEKAYPIANDRRKYFQNITQGKEPYLGYQLLCLLHKYKMVSAVWTTNFDGLIIKSAYKTNITPIEITIDSTDRIFRNQNLNELLTIALHGDYKYDKLKNTEDELKNQEVVFSNFFKNYHVDKNLIVIGYSGRDESLLNTMRQTYTQEGAGRLYWCTYGRNVDDKVVELIKEAREKGREAYLISTEGFDTTLLNICQGTITDSIGLKKELEEIISKYSKESNTISPFTIEDHKTDKYIKSNLHPIVFPKEVYQFEVEYNNASPWKFLRELIGNEDICAVPFKQKVYALGTSSKIKKVFNLYMKGDIVRVKLSTEDIKAVSTFQSLMIQAILKTFAKNKNIGTDNRNRIWNKSEFSTKVINNNKIYIYNSVFLSLHFGIKYAFVSFKPSNYIDSQQELPKQIRQQISKSKLDKVFNNKYDELLNYWNKLLFKNEKYKFSFPLESNTDFNFIISKKTAFADIKVLDPHFITYSPTEYDRRLSLFKGIQLIEPQLNFLNSLTGEVSKDFHPMRGLHQHKPIDNNLNGNVYNNQINLSVICGSEYSDKFHKFLNGFNNKYTADVNTDYLIDYNGFYSTYNINLNIPSLIDYTWNNLEIQHSEDIKTVSLKLREAITNKIERIVSFNSAQVIVIFIPLEWQPYEEYKLDEESFNLHDYIKAFASSKGISTQLIREKTLTDSLKCQIYWWLSLSFYVKSLRTPWVLNNAVKDTVFAGIGYSVTKINNKTEIVIGCSHLYNSDGQGLKYRLSKINDFKLDNKRNPFLTYEEALKFGISIRELFYENMDRLPKRIVIHKRTRFTKDEIKGITDSMKMAGVIDIDLIEINYEPDVKFLSTKVYNREIQIDSFPISRGTCLITNENEILLWTHGIVPSVKNSSHKYFQGGRNIPSPLKIVRHYGNSSLETISTEILGLTKMNWNSFDLYTKLPATISSSNQIARIGNLLSRFEGRTYDYRLFI